MASALSRPARATVIIPTYGHAPYVLWALASARAQTVREMEICVLCDGSPPEIVEMLRSVAAEDDRIQVLQFSKAPRTGEIHRARVIPKTTGRIICYLCHDDLWFPRHVETLERLLQTADFGHTLHIFAGLGSDLGTVRDALPADIAHPAFRDRMLDTRVPHELFRLDIRRPYPRGLLPPQGGLVRHSGWHLDRPAHVAQVPLRPLVPLCKLHGNHGTPFRALLLD